MTLRVGSLFTGIGGFDIGLERAGMRVAWQCEADEFCRRVLARHWPDVPCYPDVRDLRGAAVEPVDVLCGGFPCQDISLAGLGAGIDGERSGLWAEYARLVRELRPRYVIVENVSALLARGLDRVLADLAACGYDAEWDCLPASAFGAPHRRDRLWIVAYPGSEQHEGAGHALGRQAAEGLPQTVAAVADSEDGEPGEPQGSDARPLLGAWSGAGGRVGGRDLASRGRVSRRDQIAGGASTLANPHHQVGCAQGLRESAGSDERPRQGHALGSGERDVQDADSGTVQPWRVRGRATQAGGPEWWTVEPPVGRVAHGIPDRLVQLAALGNALVPQIPEWIGRRIIEGEFVR